MAKNKEKKIHISVSNSVSKKTRQHESPDRYDTMHPSWRFNRMANKNSKWYFLKSHQEFFDDIMPKLKDMEKMVWADIKSSQGHKSHNVYVEKIVKAARNEMQEMNLHVDEIFSLRLTSTKRVWGILENGILDIIWYDPKHEICPSPKK